MMDLVWFTLAAALLYLMTDWIVRQIEIYRGKPLQNKSIVFFIIILPLALITFKILERFV